MATLVLVRHAKSDYPAGVVDHDRPLSPRGRANAATIAPRIREAIPADTSLGAAISTAVRASQTWSIVAPGLPAIAQEWSDAALYLAEPSAIAEVATCFTTDVGIIVGHNPGIEELARAVPASRDAVARQMADKFPTAAFAVIDTGATPLAAWQPEDSTCTDFVTCR